MKRRILCIDHVCRILGGAEVNLIELLDSPGALPEWEVSVACDPSGPLHRALHATSIQTHPFAFDPALGQLRVVGRRFPLAGALRAWQALRTARSTLTRLIHRVRPHAVLSCTNKDHFAAWPACRAAGIPSIWWVNDILSADFFPWLARRAFVSQARRGAQRLVVVSEFARSILLRQGMSAPQVTTIHNGIPIERYRNRARGTLRRLLALPDSEPLVGILGRFTPWKGQDLFLHLAARWCQSHPQGRFLLIGHAFNEDQAFEQSLHDLVRRHRLESRVHFIPFQPEVAPVLADLDVLVHASLKPEPFGRVIIEAMAAGVPVLAANAGGVPEILTDATDGFLADPGSVESYLSKLAPLLTQPDLRARIRDQARSTVTRKFTLARVRSRFEELLRDLT
jgi:glycosyltransferase involved in cell wall biosynthesis